jgi:hypothetical protein
MDEKKRKFWDEYDAKKKERRKEEDLLRLRKEGETKISELNHKTDSYSKDIVASINNLKENFVLLYKKFEATQFELEDQIDYLRSENNDLLEKIEVLENKLTAIDDELKESKNPSIHNEDRFIKEFTLIENLISLNSERLAEKERLFQEELEKVSHDYRKLSNSVLDLFFPNTPRVYYLEAIDLLDEMGDKFNIQLNVKTISKTIILLRNISSIDKIEQGLLNNVMD